MLGEDRMNYLSGCHVLVVGLGGVGAYAAEQLCRAGIGKMTIVDADTVNESNLNRQLPALRSTIGRPKAEVVAQRLLDINPELELTVHNEFIRDERTEAILDETNYQFVVDAIDSLSPKVFLLYHALRRQIPVVSSMGAGAKTDVTKIRISDISKSYNCPLAHVVRKRMRRMGVARGFKVVFSEELADRDAIVPCDEPNKKSQVGSISYIPAVFGCACAQAVVMGLLDMV